MRVGELKARLEGRFFEHHRHTLEHCQGVISFLIDASFWQPLFESLELTAICYSFAAQLEHSLKAPIRVVKLLGDRLNSAGRHVRNDTLLQRRSDSSSDVDHRFGENAIASALITMDDGDLIVAHQPPRREMFEDDSNALHAIGRQLGCP
jgi:hypothetical protein